MRILVVDTGLSEALVHRLEDEGHRVLYYSVWEAAHPREEDLLYGQGMFGKNVVRVDNWSAHVDEADLVVFTDIGYGEAVEDLLKKGKPVVGVTTQGQSLESDRTFAQKLFPHLKYPPSESFSSPKEAISFIQEKLSGEWGAAVVKVSGFLRGTQIITHPLQAEHILSQFPDNAEAEIVVTKYIYGVEVAVGVWVGKDMPLLQYGWNMNFEEKRLMPGNLGSMTGEMGTTLFWADNTDLTTLVSDTLLPMSDWLRENYGRHYLDVNMVVEYSTGTPYILEFTTRFGYPHILITLPVIRSEFGELLWAMATGEPHVPDYDTRMVVGVGINIPGYPFDCAMQEQAHTPVVLDISDEKTPWIVPAGVYRDEDGVMRVVPGHGRAVVAVGVGDTLPEAQFMAYSLAEHVRILDASWRNDIGDRLYSQASYLLRHKYISTRRYNMIVPYHIPQS